MRSRASALPVLAAVAALGLAPLAACARPPVGPPDDDTPEAGRAGPIALELFTQDRPAISGRWYDYEPDGHTLTPRPYAWLLRDTSAAASPGDARYAALRIVDIYESDAAESGRFTFGVALYDAGSGTWGAEQTWVTPRNVKLTGQMCVDVFAQSERACDDGGAWQLRLALTQHLSTLAQIAVAEPSVFVHDAVARVARVDDVADLAALAAAVPDPRLVPELDDAPAPWGQGVDATDWAFDRFAKDLPEAGMAIGARFAGGPDDVYWLMTARFDLVRFTVRAVDEETLRFGYATVPVDRDDGSAPTPMPAPIEVDVALPAPGEGAWLTFDNANDDGTAAARLELDAEHLVDTAWPQAPPKTTRFDVAVARAGLEEGGAVRLLVSQGAAVLNATQLGLDEDVPPVSTP